VTFAPPTLLQLAGLWTGAGGVNLGIVGDTAHLAKGVSYHLGRDDLLATAYSAQTTRDRAGLSNAASAIDLGKLGGSYVALRAFSIWLVEQARHNAPGTSDMREIIYSPDGVAVLRWDRERGYSSAPRAGEADTSHRTHTHVSWYRDAETRDHRTAFLPYLSKLEAAVDYINAGGGVSVRSDRLLPVKQGQGWQTFGSPAFFGTFSSDDMVPVLGRADSVTGAYACLIVTGRVYPDGSPRETVVLVKSGVALADLTPAPAEAPVDCSAVEAALSAAQTALEAARARAREAVAVLERAP
jgi:hypothetical protein